MASTKRQRKQQKEESFAPPIFDDSIIINSGGVISYVLDFATTDLNEIALIEMWRELATRSEVDWAISEIINEAVVTDYIHYPVSLEILQTADLPEKIKIKLQEQFNHVLSLLNFNRTAGERFRQWYIDGKHYYHGILDSENPSNGLVAIRWIDPRTIKKIVEVEKSKNDQGIETESVKDIYYLYNAYIPGRSNQHLIRTRNAVKVEYDAIAYANSGIFKERNDGTTIAISFLDKAVKPANQLRLLEDSVVIYRLARAPERRIFYVDTGNLPKTKAEQYLYNIMNRFRNKMVYDIGTGEVKDQRNILSILEDYWLPRREGGRGTEVSTLPGGQNLGEMEDVEYFYKKLYRALNIPITRLQSETAFNLGRSAEITREEVKFAKFISYLRSKFSETFVQLLKMQVVATNVMSAEDYDQISPYLAFKWKTDSYWDELMSNEIWQTRANLLQQLEQYVGKYFSEAWIKKNILLFSDEEAREIHDQIQQESKSVQADEDEFNVDEN